MTSISRYRYSVFSRFRNWFLVKLCFGHTLAGTIVAFYNGVRLPFRLGGPKDTWEVPNCPVPYLNLRFTVAICRQARSC